MIHRYASHYLWVPGEGYLRQQVVEVDGCHAVRHYPLPGEIEDVEWLPGVIVLLPAYLPPPFPSYARLVPCHLFPFDLTSLQPVAGTRHRLLP